MNENPYESPRSPGEVPPERRWFRPRKHPVGYLAATFVGATVGAGLLMPSLAPLDDSGGVQMCVGIFIALVIYHFLF